MTREEIMELEAGRELDALIAEKVMGWTLHPHKTHWIVPVTNGWTPRFLQVGNFNPSTDIAAAWEVANGFPRFHVQKSKYDYNCVIFGRDDEYDAFARADTAPLAICRAALLAVS